MTRLALALLLMLSLVSTPITAQDFNRGLAAIQAGDYATGFQELTPLAKAGHSRSQYILGLAYDQGVGIPKDNQKAMKWFKLAAQQGYAYAQFTTGNGYLNGRGVPKDYKEAVKWYRLAAEQGHSGAQSNLGFMYGDGRGVPQDEREAVKWYRLAAEQGVADAQSNLGTMYLRGHGIAQDDVMAYMWYNIASANGNDEAGKGRDELAGLMTREDISKAQNMARECMESDYKMCRN